MQGALLPGLSRHGGLISAKHSIIFWLVFVGVLAGLAPAYGQALPQVVFLPQWIPQAQFAGYYVAFEKGYYRNKGIDLKILKGGPERSPAEWLEKGLAEFGTLMLSQAIKKRTEGIKLVNIGQIVQKSSLMLVAKKSRGIRTAEDLRGRKIGLWKAEFQIQPRAFFRMRGLDFIPVRQSESVNLFLRGAVDAVSATWYNEYHLILNAGLNPEELTLFSFPEYGLNFPEDGLYCLEKTWQKDPGLACRLVQASIEGWQEAFDHPEEALDTVMKYAREAQAATNRAHQQWMLLRMKDLIRPQTLRQPMGKLTPEAYTLVGQTMIRQKLISALPTFEDFYKSCFDRAP
jgi:NitT/TauT family transport system substrate-binding protein